MSTLAGTGTLVRLVLRRDRVRLPLWALGVVGLVLVSASSVRSLYPTQADIENYVSLVEGNPASIATTGPGYGFDDPNIGVVVTNETSVWGAVALALMSIFLVVRHTRTEEEAERTELVRSGVVGRDAPLAAALLVVAAANLLIAGITAVGLAAMGFEVTGAVALCGSFAAVGLVFAATAAVTAQVVTTGRGAVGLAAAVLGAAFVLRAAGDVGDGTLSWLSPIGWGQAVRPFADERWWTLGLCVAAAVALTGAAVVVLARRDLGGGLVAQRPGPASAAAWLASPLGLAVRLQRGAVVAWSAGLFLLGLVYGAVGRDAEQFLEDSPEIEDFLVQYQGASITDSFFAVSLSMLALIASGFAISSALRLRAEETADRAEPVLATPTSRWTWAGSSLAVTVVGTVVVVVAGGLGTGVGYALAVGDAGEVPALVGASLAYLPAVLVLAAVGAALFGLAPRFTLVAWAVLAAVVVVTLFAELLELPQWARDLSPFEHTPALPAVDLAVTPIAVLLVLAAALLVAGLVGFRTRDVAG